MPLRPGAEPRQPSRLRRFALPLVVGLPVLLLAAAVARDDLLEPAPSPPAAAPAPVVPAADGGEPPPCTHRTAPTEQLQDSLDRLRAGDVLCLAPGAYGAVGTRTLWSSGGEPGRPATVRAASGALVELLGAHQVLASHLVLQGLVFAGPTGLVTPENTPEGEDVLVWVDGDAVALRDCEVRDGRWHAGIYVTGDGVEVTRCWVHTIGTWDDPEQQQRDGRASNLSHGVYWESGADGVLSNSILERNLAYGLQVQGDTRRLLAVNNTIVRNGRGGVIIAGPVSDVHLANNIVAHNAGLGVTQYEVTGERNLASDNLLWANARGDWNAGPVTTDGNRAGDPRFAGDRDYRLLPGSAALDVAEPALAPAVDHVGRVRPQGGGVDVGALEHGRGADEEPVSRP